METIYTKYERQQIELTGRRSRMWVRILRKAVVSRRAGAPKFPHANLPARLPGPCVTSVRNLVETGARGSRLSRYVRPQRISVPARPIWKSARIVNAGPPTVITRTPSNWRRSLQQNPKTFASKYAGKLIIISGNSGKTPDITGYLNPR